MARKLKDPNPENLPAVISRKAENFPPEGYSGKDYKHQKSPSIEISESDLKLHLQSYENGVRASSNLRAYAGELLTLIVGLTTSHTVPKFGLEASTWEAIYVIAAGIFLILLAFGLLSSISLSNAIQKRSIWALYKPNVNSISRVLERIKASSFSRPRPDAVR